MNYLPQLWKETVTHNNDFSEKDYFSSSQIHDKNALEQIS